MMVRNNESMNLIQNKDKTGVTILTLEVNSGEHKGTIFTSKKETWKERITEIQEQLDKKGIKITLIQGAE